MTILEQAEDLRNQAVSLLLQERERIDKKLIQLGYGTEEKKTRKHVCGRCGSEGHTIRTCPTPLSETT